ncbi:FAD binding domain-containing protein [Nannocystaceae bacterium ST9]
MLRLPQFGVVMPETVAGVVEALKANPGARILAGGTDLLPNLKHWLDEPPLLVSLAQVRELRTIAIRERALELGAGMTLREISEHPEVTSRFPSLAHAAGIVASPLIRNMGTIGGNVNLDTRCRYVNQTAFWRQAIGGGCLKSEGDVCHVVPGGQNCVAAMSSDCVPVLISLGASIVMVGPEGTRELPLDKYFKADGIAHTHRAEGELTCTLRVPLPEGPRRSAYAKWTVRKSIDFPLVSVALCFELERDEVHAPVRAATVVVGVLGAKPRVISGLEAAVGKKLSDPALARLVADAVHKQCKPLENVPYEAPYRRQMLGVYTRRAIEGLVAAG